MGSLATIAAFAEVNGVRFVLCKTNVPHGSHSPSPFCRFIGLSRELRELYYLNSEKPSERWYAIGGLIHELGHLLAEVSSHDETNFVAWEWRTALSLGATVARYWWRYSMVDYDTNNAEYFGSMATSDKLSWLRERILDGIQLGNVCPKTLRPIALRGPLAGVPWSDQCLNP